MSIAFGIVKSPINMPNSYYELELQVADIVVKQNVCLIFGFLSFRVSIFLGIEHRF
jgi:hypothetical protein